MSIRTQARDATRYMQDCWLLCEHTKEEQVRKFSSLAMIISTCVHSDHEATSSSWYYIHATCLASVRCNSFSNSSGRRIALAKGEHHGDCNVLLRLICFSFYWILNVQVLHILPRICGKSLRQTKQRNQAVKTSVDGGMLLLESDGTDGGISFMFA